MTDDVGLPQLSGRDEDPLEAVILRPLREVLDINPEQWTSLTQLITLHMLLDRLVTLKVIYGVSTGKGGGKRIANVSRIEKRVARLSFDHRLQIAEAAGWIAPDVAADVAAVNSLRNKLLHFHPGRHSFEDIPEIASAEAFFDVVARRGLLAFNALREELGPLFNPPAPTS